MMKVPPLVTPSWVHEHLNHDAVVILDASFNTNDQEGVLPNSRYFDLKDTFLDRESEFPNTVPKAAHFERECQRLGINTTSHIVVYDTIGIYTSPRVWWLFRVMGHEKISVLDGGLPAWIAHGFETVSRTEAAFELGDFKARFDPRQLKDFEEVSENVLSASSLLIDARSSGRFAGVADEPRAHLSSGHIPNSMSIPYQEVLDGNTYKSKEALSALFERKGVANTNKDLIFSCGSGITACIVLLASILVQDNRTAVYDGSWTEWAEKHKLFRE